MTVPEGQHAAGGVAEALAELDGLDGLDVARHVSVYERISAVLRDALADLDSAGDAAEGDAVEGDTVPGGAAGTTAR